MNYNFNQGLIFFVVLLEKLKILTPKRIIKIKYFLKFGYSLNFNNPQNLNEKILWLSFFSDTYEWTKLADKFKVREYVEECGLGHQLVKLYGVYDRVEDINFDELPNSFVLKTNNGSGTVLLVKNKKELNIEQTNRLLRKWLKIPFGLISAEPHYRRMKPCIIAEEFLINDNPNSSSLVDYKIWCFNGEPHYIFTACDRGEDTTVKFGLYNAVDWSSLNQHITEKYRQSALLPKPCNLHEMLESARKLAKDFPQVRVDFYEVKGQIYFGELTFTSHGGLTKSYTSAFLKEMGNKIDLSLVNRKKVMAVSSIGGHWIQLLRITKPLHQKVDVVYVCTHIKCATMVEGNDFYVFEDFSRWDFYKLIPAFFKAIRYIKKEKPDVIISTGAAPGLITLIAGKILGRKTIWVDSIANVEKLSFSGRIASKFVSKVYTQWEELAEKNIFYTGNVLG